MANFWEKLEEKLFNFKNARYQEKFILEPGNEDKTEDKGEGKAEDKGEAKGQAKGEGEEKALDKAKDADQDKGREQEKDQAGDKDKEQNQAAAGEKEDKERDADQDKNKLKKPRKPLPLHKQKEKRSGKPEDLYVSMDLETNREYLNKIYALSKNKDIIIRDFYIATKPPLKAFLIFIDGLTDKNIINNDILKSLMVLIDEGEIVEERGRLAEYVMEHLLPGHDVALLDQYRSILDLVNYGNTAIFIEGCDKSLVIETKGWDRRGVGIPQTEEVIFGPHEAFNETLRSNTGLIRKALRNEKLITEIQKIGSRTNVDVAIMYIDDLANPKLVEEVKHRIASIKTDYIGVAGILEQFIEDAPFKLAPQVLTTERPDRVVSFLVEGHVAIIVDGSAQALIVPVTMFSLLHSPEDYYLRVPYGNFLRVLRVLALFITLLTPGLYVSVVNFHQEMIPTELLLAIAAAHVIVPFPTIFELFVMEFAFELIREAGVRVPGVIGNTIGIVGALILGQAAAQAGIISPILIIVVAITGLASFAIPNYSISFGLRFIRFVFTILAAFFGFFGISGSLFLFLVTMVSMKSFGVPFLAPVGPPVKTEPDVVLRGPVWSMEKRVDYLTPLDEIRQPKISRGWIKNTRGGKQQ